MSTKHKDYFDSELAELLANKISEHLPEFRGETFVIAIKTGIEDLELKARVDLIANQLNSHLTEHGDYLFSLDILMKILGPENPNETGMFTEWYWLMPVAAYVEKYGQDHFDRSIEAIKEITKRHTGEYAVRPYIKSEPDKCLALMAEWAVDSNMHVRRLASEGLRPRLPWSGKLDQFIADPNPVIAILEKLKEDQSKFVQKSVANNMGDILKDNYELALKVLKRWAKSKDKNTRWIVKHALRNAVKKEKPEALAILKELAA